MVHRYELSGVLHGLFRVRGFVQDDAHVYCTPDQIEDEVIDCVDMLEVVYRALGFEQIDVKLSTRPEDRMGDDSIWDKAEAALAGALDKHGLKYVVAHGDGAFYGPKIDFDLTDCLGRKWQCGTIQLDFQMPERFDLEYVGADGERHRPVMIHRAIVGSLERMIGILIEEYAGKLPMWLSPVQATVLPIIVEVLPFAETVRERLAAAGIRVELDGRNEKIGAKIRDATLQRVPYMLVVGKREAESGKVAVRARSGEDLGPMDLDAFLEMATGMIRERS
jgi:threonyl-tRNA synthetase